MSGTGSVGNAFLGGRLGLRRLIERVRFMANSKLAPESALDAGVDRSLALSGPESSPRAAAKPGRAETPSAPFTTARRRRTLTKRRT
jgi:hypothetical protein